MSDDEWGALMAEADAYRAIVEEAEDEQEYEAMLAEAPWNNGQYDWYTEFVEDGE